MELTWKRDPHSGHWAYGDTYGYQLKRDGRRWLLQVRRVVVTVTVRHTLGSEVLHCWTTWFDTLPEAKAVVQLFEDGPHDMLQAELTYHDTVVKPRLDAIVAEYDRMIANRNTTEDH